VIVTRVIESPEQLYHYTTCLDLIVQEFPEVKYNHVDSVQELFPKLSDPKFSTDLICIPVTELYRQDGTSVFDLINTLSTLIKCTVQRVEAGKPQRRTTKIMCLVNEHTDPKVIREVLKIPDLFIGYLTGGKFTAQHGLEFAREILKGNYETPKLILDLIKPKKKKIKSISSRDTISLTLRQAQILQLIQDRGISNKLIARMLNISESTVKLHVTAILKKYGVKNRTQLVLFAPKQDIA
jgi:DNA-binding NarL/FixJ family response regulator